MYITVQFLPKCPMACGDGIMKRNIYCNSGTSSAESACSERTKPQTEKRCRGESCGGNWFTGPWSEVGSAHLT